MQKCIIDVTGQVELTYDENSDEFKEALIGYQESIQKGGSKESMLTHVAFHVTRFGVGSMVEGVGYVGWGVQKPTEEPDSGIMVNQDYNEFDFEIIDLA